MPKIKKILIANRGEITLRIIRTCRELGIKTVAVYSEADRTSPHVQLADEAVLIGPPPSSSSYLVQEKIINAAKATGADAIHPGYGFLSENAGFARAVQKAGLIFIGPPADAIALMGDKLQAREAAEKSQVPVVPGSPGAVTDPKKGMKIAEKIGFPVMIKASAGGGGKGMRIVHDLESFTGEMKRAMSEAQSAFGDGSVFIEKFITSPKHIEIQVLGDQHGNILHLFERECSVQRRHQKVVEEAPSPVVDAALREEMGNTAVQVAKACGYYGAGTVEFIMDEDKNYYFLEMNTRLQVEHPVTELITGLDLVKEQIHIAEGKKLSFVQKDLTITGHAIELRVYAEDPENNYLPQTGTLKAYRRPQGPGVRVDDGFSEGMEIPIHYDPMIAKLIVHGANRKEAIGRMIRAIEEYHIVGVPTTLELGKFIMQHQEFVNGKFTTHFLGSHYPPKKKDAPNEDIRKAGAALAAIIYADSANSRAKNQTNTRVVRSKWKDRSKLDG